MKTNTALARRTSGVGLGLHKNAKTLLSYVFNNLLKGALL